MFRRRIILFMGLTLLFIGALNLVGQVSYRAGWTEGYFATQQAERTAESSQVGPYRPGWGVSPFFWFIGGLFKFWLLLLFFGLMFKVLVCGRRHRGTGKHRHSQRPDDVLYEKKPEDVEPQIGL